jgi:hypothetical protein
LPLLQRCRLFPFKGWHTCILLLIWHTCILLLIWHTCILLPIWHTVFQSFKDVGFFRAKEIREKPQRKRKLKQHGKRKLKYQDTLVLEFVQRSLNLSKGSYVKTWAHMGAHIAHIGARMCADILVVVFCTHRSTWAHMYPPPHMTCVLTFLLLSFAHIGALEHTCILLLIWHVCWHSCCCLLHTSEHLSTHRSTDDIVVVVFYLFFQKQKLAYGHIPPPFFWVLSSFLFL